jgi:4-hydroxy-tetrahydrodipicolinate synthase
MRGRFGDLITAMVTPFDNDGKLDVDASQKLADWLVEQRSEGLVLAGSTGEGPTLNDEEKIALWKAVVEAVGGRASIIANSGTYDTAHSIHLTKEAEKAGVDAILAVTPYYNRPPQNGLSAHFRAIAAATGLPVLLYDIPIRTGRKIEHPTLIELSSVDNIVGVKDACGDPQGAARLISEAPGDFQVYSGNDADTLPWLSVGAVGVIAVASHIVGPQMSEMIERFHSNDPETARKIHLELMPVFDAMSITTNPIPVKAALELMGHKVGAPRLPLPEATKDQKNELKKVISSAGVM